MKMNIKKYDLYIRILCYIGFIPLGISNFSLICYLIFNFSDFAIFGLIAIFCNNSLIVITFIMYLVYLMEKNEQRIDNPQI